MFNFFRPSNVSPTGLLGSTLFDENTFYGAFMNDLKKCKEEIIIENPFVTTKRARMFVPVFKELINIGVNIHIITRDPEENHLRVTSTGIIETFENIVIDIFISTGNHHRKIAILDRQILWEGCLNILSQSSSRKIMRRIQCEDLAMQIFSFIELNRVF